MAKASLPILRICHRFSAILLGIFLALHMANHIVGLMGQAQHMAFMQAIRPIYRGAVIEPVMLALLTWQLASGILMVLRGWRTRRGIVAWLQAASGLYLAFFVTVHVVSVLSGRMYLHLDTDFRFAAAGFQVALWSWYFGPYYFLGVAALFTHVGCALYWSLIRVHPHAAAIICKTMVVTGVVLGLLIVMALAGLFYQPDIPAVYKSTYGGI